MGPHQEAALELGGLVGARTFVESGTYKGKTTRWAASQFDTVYTIERAKPFYDRYAGELQALGNIHTRFGDSRECLPEIVRELGDSPAIFWLDGHWSGGMTAGEEDECPLLDELRAIKHRRNDIIMIDDARLFLAAPPVGFDADQWPGIFDIAMAMGDDVSRYATQIFHDIIFLGPRSPEVLACLRKWARAHAKALGREDTG